MSDPVSYEPSWDHLFQTASVQEGLFTTEQAAEAGYSSQLLGHHLRGGRIARLRRGIYRLVHFPPGEHEDLVAIWLWSEQAGVISHQSALALHELSDALPADVHLSLPADWKQRRLRVPESVTLHYADVPQEDRAWLGAVPTTNARRTLNDCARAGCSPELLRHGAQQALRRGLVRRDELDAVAIALQAFGGIDA